MKKTFVAAAALFLTFAAAPLAAQEAGVVSDVEITKALGTQGAEAEADRSAVDRVLSTDAARKVAESIGVDLERARSGASMLEGEDLREAGSLARTIEDQLAGGQTFSINATTLIVILLLVIIVVLIAD